MSEIEFENSPEDLIQFKIFHVKNSETGERARNRNAIGAAAAAFLVVNGMAAISGVWSPGTVLQATLLAGLAGWISWPVTKLGIRRRAAQMYKQGAERGLTGWHRLQVVDGSLEEHNSAGSVSHRLSSIHRIPATEDYVYIYISPASAHVIPTDKVFSGDLADFMEVLRAGLEADKM